MSMLSALALSNPPPPGKELDLFQLVLSSGGVVLFVLFLLIVFFVVTTFVIGYKGYQLVLATRETDQFLDTFWQVKRLEKVYDAPRSCDARRWLPCFAPATWS
jgi:hypothetical protein